LAHNKITKGVKNLQNLLLKNLVPLDGNGAAFLNLPTHSSTVTKR